MRPPRRARPAARSARRIRRDRRRAARHHLAGRAHLRAARRRAGEALAREDRLLRPGARRPRPLGEPERGERLAEQQPARRARRAARRSPSRRTAPCATRAGSPRAPTARPPCTASCRLSRPRAPRPRAIAARRSRISASSAGVTDGPGSDAGRVARVDARRLDVLQHRGDPRAVAVAERVDVELERALEVAVDEARARRRAARRRARDVHAAAADHVVRPDEHRVADPLRDRERLVRVVGRAPTSARAGQLASSARSGRVLGRVDRVERVAEQRHPGRGERRARRSGVWPPNETTTPSGCSSSHTSSTRSSVSGSR